MATSRRYRVYVWKSRSAKAASIVEDITAQSVDNAINAVMFLHNITQAAYVWVADHEDDRRDVHRYDVTYQLPPLSSLQSTQGGRSDGRRTSKR